MPFFTRPLKSAKATRIWLLMVTWVAFFLRAATLANQSLWRDEVDAIRFSSWSLPELAAGLVQVSHNGPLYFLLLSFWRTFTGNSEYALRFPSAGFGVLLIPLGYALARRLGLSRRAGLLTGLLLTTSPYLLWYSQEAKMYTMLTALVGVAFLAYLKALAGGGRWWAVFVTATSLSFYTHILAPLMLIVYVVVGLGHVGPARRRWRGWLVSMALLTGPYLPLAWWQAPRLVRGYASGHQFYPLSEEVYLLLQLYSRGLIRFAGLLPVIAALFLLLAGLFLSIPPARRVQFNSRAVLAAWLLIPPLAVYLISLRVPVFEDRYLIYITPAFYLLLAAGLTKLRRHWRWLAALGLGTALLVNGLGLHLQQRQPIKADFRAAAAWLAAQPAAPNAIMVQIPYLQHTLNYYYPRPYTFLAGPWTNDNKDEATLHREMIQLTAGKTELWLVVSEEPVWDSRGLVKTWLAVHADLQNEAHFARVDVYHYGLAPGAVEQQSIVPDPP
jgi:uncharacterized membrane protein